VHALIAGGVTPDNTPHGYNWSFGFPMLLFIVIALVLWALFGRPHQRVPTRRIALGLSSRLSDAGSAHAAAVAGGLSLAPGAAPTESPAEPGGAHLTASVEPPPEEAADEPDGEAPPAGEAGGGE